MKRVLRKIYRKASRGLQCHGVVGSARLAIQQAAQYVRTRALATFADAPPVSAFDSTWNVETDGLIDLSELHVVDGTNYILGNQYVPTAPEGFVEMIQAVPIPFEDCVFIDCGAGKGRVLLMASEFPFRRIIGIEFAIELARTAEANIRAYTSPSRKCSRLEVLCMDATVFTFPLTPTVLYLYHPFERPVMEVFVRRVEDSLREEPRPFFVLYRNPKLASMWEESGCFTKAKSSDSFAIYTYQPRAGRP